MQYKIVFNKKESWKSPIVEINTSPILKFKIELIHDLIAAGLSKKKVIDELFFILKNQHNLNNIEKLNLVDLKKTIVKVVDEALKPVV